MRNIYDACILQHNLCRYQIALYHRYILCIELLVEICQLVDVPTTINKCMTPTIRDSDCIPRLYIKLLAFNAQ